MDAVLERFEAAAAQSAAEKLAAYRRLVADLAEGNEPNPDAALGVLESAGKSSDDLRADVATLQRRRELAATLSQAGTLETELAEIEGELSEISERRAKANAEFDRQAAPLTERRAKLLKRHSQVERIRHELLSLAPPEIAARERPLVEQRHRIVERRRLLTEHLDALHATERRMAASLAADKRSLTVALFGSQARKAERRQNIARQEGELARLRGETIRQVEGELAELHAAEVAIGEQLAALHNERMTP